MLKQKHIPLPFEVKELTDEGQFEGYGSIANNVDLGGDIVEPGAFKESLAEWGAKGRFPKMLWQHDPSQPIGVWTEMREDEKGLFVRGRLLKEIQKGLEAHILLKSGAIEGLSIGYETVDSEMEGNGVRRLKTVHLWEVSIVTFPMNPKAGATRVKHLESPIDVERILREAGVPKQFAKEVALHGFDEANKRVNGRAVPGAAPESEAAVRLLNALKARKEISNG